MTDIYLTISRDELTDRLQLSIDDSDGGYRIAGPKFSGSSETLLKHKLSERDASEIRDYLQKLINLERVP